MHEGDTFYNYLQSNDTNNVRWYKLIFASSLEFLPQRVCSSKVIWDCLLENNVDLRNNYIKSTAFTNAFSEYFKWKLNKVRESIKNEVYSQESFLIGR